jgi:putative endonuclease
MLIDETVLRLHPREPAGRGDLYRCDQQSPSPRYEHKNRLLKGFTERYRIDKLVYFEVYDSPTAATQREKTMKHWPRVWKTRLIAQTNPTWRDLYEEIAA